MLAAMLVAILGIRNSHSQAKRGKRISWPPDEAPAFATTVGDQERLQEEKQGMWGRIKWASNTKPKEEVSVILLGVGIIEYRSNSTALSVAISIFITMVNTLLSCNI